MNLVRKLYLIISHFLIFFLITINYQVNNKAIIQVIY